MLEGQDPETVNKFVKYYTHGYVKKRGEHLPAHYKYDELQVKALVNFIHCAKDFDTFYKAAAWARERVNEDLFWYAINVVKLHRDDLFQLATPPYYELYPQLFVSDGVISEAWKATLRGKTFNKGEPYVIHANYSGLPYAEEADELLSYYTEDVGLLAFRDFLRFRFPFWAKREDYGQANETHRGDRFYYDIKTTLSRYSLERLSNNLPDIEPLDYEKPVPGVKPDSSLAEPPIVGTTSAIKSPLFYKIAKRVAMLMLPGVTVESLTVDKLVTYFEDYDFELNNAVPVASQEEAARLNVVARQQRLTHVPFNYHVKVTSDREMDVFVRFFIGPVYDAYGKKLSMDERRHKMVYIDSFGMKLKRGVNEVLRRSKDISSYTQLPMSFTQLFGATEVAMASGTQPFFNYIMRVFGDIDRLMLPRGTREGLPLCTYVIISPCSTNTNGRIDPYTKDMCPKTSLFPFDRPINELEFDVPNALFGETVIFHRNAEEVVVV
ncbi:allergen Cr-PI-like [Schistocerca gregaria]|uniref:allergen Cr-PI-like n=1 Tax=Schistocerca gregaria TaxID=7010 RepID=UPI00211EDCB0|nr:allergen Cr-PI-like [Schistocerca gregaria]